jgi:hypothetical protein
MVYGNVMLGDKKSNFLRVSGNSFRRVLKNLSLCPFSGMMVRKDLVPWDNLDLTLPAWQDDDFCLSVSRDQEVMFVDTITAKMKPSTDSISKFKHGQFIGLATLINNWKDYILNEFGYGRLILWRLRLLAILFLVISQDFQSTPHHDGISVIHIRFLSLLFAFLGKLLRGILRLFFDRCYA